ncbi:hypothetical protein EYF80_047770 [Liparis tanakae]|uniref:Uncharacterized protein n=1 Tax=Liparis tanakae TaxID=230148 RepID=A0A4Z2FMQ6_9TELE|nr:hypothetical protein EYF80_047770 [Liparis tanakae]
MWLTAAQAVQRCTSACCQALPWASASSMARPRFPPTATPASVGPAEMRFLQSPAVVIGTVFSLVRCQVFRRLQTEQRALIGPLKSINSSLRSQRFPSKKHICPFQMVGTL